MYHGIWASIIFIFSFSSIMDKFSSVLTDIWNILSSGFIIVIIDNGNIMNDTNGTKIRFIRGVIIFISWKLFISIGMLVMNDIKLVINSFDIYFL